MNIERVIIANFKKYEHLDITLLPGINILVGDNDSGKSTILESIDLALSGTYRGRQVKFELSQSMFNRDCVNKFLDAMKIGDMRSPPEIKIEVFMNGDEAARFDGNQNSVGENLCGFLFCVRIDRRNDDLYQEWVESKDFESLPIELYNTYIVPFSRDEELTHRHIPIKPALIDAASTKGNSDVYLSKILKDVLSNREIVEVSRAFRNSNGAFAKDSAISAINGRISEAAKITDRSLSLSVDLPAKNAWESGLQTFIDDVPFYANGKGEQSLVKTKIALSHKKTKTKNILLIEEPENHLSHTTLNKLLSDIKGLREDRQILISTHSSFVANKLGLKSLILLGPLGITKLDSLDPDTQDFFEKIAGYDTLRMLLCKRAILVEGGSDELIIQRSYMDKNSGNLPIENGIDVISVGTAFERFIKLGKIIGVNLTIVTDSDGDPEFLEGKYREYLSETIRVNYDKVVDEGVLIVGKKPYNYNTLEPKLLKANSLAKLNKILETKFETEDDLRKHMLRNKVDSALKIFESSEAINYPQYIIDSVS